MKLVCVMLLIATALVNAASMDIHMSTRLASGIRGFLAKTSGILHDKRGGAGIDHRLISTKSRLRVAVGNTRGRFAAKSCVSEDQCKKKKAICSKRCSQKHGGKCVVKCKKCTPTC